MKPVDMKVSRKAAEAAVGIMQPASKGKVYPWGLEIRLDSAALDKLGIKELPEAGAECMLSGVGKVIEVAQAATEGAKTRRLTIQITKLALDHEDGEEAMARGYARKRGRRY
jgi:hypothetical protein